jgi:hypothetical protein
MPYLLRGKPEREGFEPSWQVSPPNAFPESLRSLTGPVRDRLLNALRPIGPTATDWLGLPIGIGVGIIRGLRMDAATHRLPELEVTPLIASEAGEGTRVRSPLGFGKTVEFQASGTFETTLPEHPASGGRTLGWPTLAAPGAPIEPANPGR